MKTETKIEIGTRIHNNGDSVCDPDHFGAVVEIKETDWGNQYRIEVEGGHLEDYWVTEATIRAGRVEIV